MTVPVLLGPDARPIQHAPLARPRPGAYARAYHGASLSDPDLSTWSTRNPSPQSAIASDRDNLAARIHDLARNDGWASGGVARIVDSIIGSGWRLASKPNAKALGISEDDAFELADQFEAHWKLWADDVDASCDASGRLNWGGLLALGFRHRIWDGEAIAHLDWIDRSYAYSTAVQVIHPDRLSNPNGGADTTYLRSGVALDRRGAPQGYWFRASHPGEAALNDIRDYRWEFVARRTDWGRPQVVHAFEPEAAGQFRGVSPLAPILKKIRMIGRYDEAELQAAILNAVLAAFVTSPFDHEQLAEAMGAGEVSNYQQCRLDFHKEAPISLPGVKVNFLSPGEDVKLTNPNHPNSVFEAYERAVLRNIATAIGVSYEQLSMDWSQVNYSSARAALIEIWRGFTARKDNFAFQYAQPIYAAVLEEAIDKGDIRLPKGAPNFYQGKTAYCQADWIGPGRGWVDPYKEAQAAEKRLQIGVSTDEREAAEQGMDWKENLIQQARETRERERLGLPPRVFGSGAAPSAEPDSDDAKKESAAA
jgi:lambda family phage portal protein